MVISLVPVGKAIKKKAISAVFNYQKAIQSGDYDLVILDEYNMALFFELISWEKTQALLDTRNPETELVFTGRGAPQELLDAADLVTEMKEVKHYYMQGVMARKGIES